MAPEETVASLLRELRRRQGQSLRSAAADLGVAPSQLSRMERGERPVGSEVVRKLSSYYKVPEESISLAHGNLPPDIVQILRDHPEEIARIRQLYLS
ncbi:helix-turn-helix domain-containing protein [Microcella pacifica]|uniref:helix-turn-helix domain-containing protein n=1 Tax=Microcella pacifica TaxID=2591847 RepID=UPI00331475CF